MASSNFSSSSIDLILTKNNILTAQTIAKIKQIISEKLKDIPVSQFKSDPELSLLVCDLVWNLAYEFSLPEDFNKIQIVIEILTSIFNYNTAEIEILKNQINYFINHKRIKIIPFRKKMFSSFVKLVLKKVL